MPRERQAAQSSERAAYGLIDQGAAAPMSTIPAGASGRRPMAVRKPPMATSRHGSNNTTSRVFGVAAGADYRFSPNTIAGFALAGGGTNFSVAGGGSGRSDLFQAGAFVKHTIGAAYISGALAYGWQDITTDRTVTVGAVDRLRAQFNANAFSGRAEGGYRFVAHGSAASASRRMPPDSSRRSTCQPTPSKLSPARTPSPSPTAQGASPPRAANSACAPTSPLR